MIALNDSIDSLLQLEWPASVDMCKDKLTDDIKYGAPITLHKSLRPVPRARKITSTKVTRVCNEGGYLATSHVEEKLCFRKLFTDQLAGAPCSLEDLLNRDRACLLEMIPPAQNVPLSIDIAPNPCDVIDEMDRASGARPLVKVLFIERFSQTFSFLHE